jgi:DNA-binding CsgD family transcriptional regulator
MPAAISKLRLTPREVQCVVLFTEGLTDQEIGGALGVSSSTVRAHLRNVHRRLGTRQRAALSIWLADVYGQAYELAAS